MRIPLCIFFAALLPLSRGIEPLPNAPGFSGFLSPGLASLNFRDNLVAGAGSLDVGNKRVDSLTDSPRSEEAVNLSLTGEVGYKFADRELYVFFGNRLEDLLRLDNSSALGARFHLGGESIWELSALFSSVPTQLWEDPYLIGADREETDRTSGGVRAGVANLSGTGVEINLTLRQIEIENERSGAAAGLDAAEQSLLRRDGDTARLEILRPWVLNARHLLVPAINFGVYDAEGAAMSREGFGVQITHMWQAGRLRTISNISLSRSDYDEANPVFGKKQDEESILLSLTGFYRNLFDLPSLSGMASVLYAERNSDINFHDADATVFSLGVLYRF